MENRWPLVAALPEGDRLELLDRAVPRHLARGDSLHLAGDLPQRVHLIVRGVVKLSARDGEGDETILGLALPGMVVGDIAAVDGGFQPLDSVAATAVDALGMEAERFREIIFRNPRAALELARLTAERTRWMVETAIERTSGEVTTRLAGRLLDLAELLGRQRGAAIELELPVGQRDLGRLAGICRESTCKTMRRLKAAGVVDYEGRRLRILRPDSLRKMKCGF